MASLPSVAIGSSGYKISLLSVSPGREEQVADQLYSSIREQTGKDPVCVLKIFGKYDICAIYPTDDYLSGPSKIGSINDIRSGNQVLAFPWVTSSQLPHDLAGKDPVWGLLFFKVSSTLSSRLGGYIEHVLCSYWNKQVASDVHLSLWGTTGWAELVFIVNGKTLSSVASALSAISQQVLVVEKESDKEENLFSAKTYSLVGIDFSLARKANRDKLSKVIPERIVVGRSIYPTLSVTCAPGDMHAVMQYGLANLGKAYSTFGGTDIQFKPTKCRTWGRFLQAVLTLRESMSDKLFSTAISLMCESDAEALADCPLKHPSHRPVEVSKAAIVLFDRWGPIFETRLKNLFFGLSNLLQDPLVGDTFEELRPVLTESLPYILSSSDPKNDSQRKFLGQMIDAVAHAAEERTFGAFLAMEEVRNHFSPTNGGVQRILQAANYIPRVLFTRLGMKWNGFVMAGFRNQGFSSLADFLNLPLSLLARPNEWWGLFHEIGHAALLNKEFMGGKRHEIKKAIREAFPSTEKDYSYFEFLNIVWEIGADMFDLYFCHRGAFDLYVDNIWSYVAPSGRGLSEPHYVRYFCAYVYWQHLLREESANFPVAIDVDAELHNFRKYIRERNLPIPSFATYDYSAKIFFQRVRNIIEIYHRAFVEKDALTSLSDIIASDGIQEPISYIIKGEVFLREAVKSPDALLLALESHPQRNSFSVRMAMIMTLVHSSQMSLR